MCYNVGKKKGNDFWQKSMPNLCLFYYYYPARILPCVKEGHYGKNRID